MKKILSRRVLLLLTLLSATFLMFVLFQTQMLPVKYLVVIATLLFVIVLLLYKGECDKDNKHPIRVVLLKLVNVLLAIALVFASLLILKGDDFITAIAGAKEETIEIDVVVMKNSTYQNLNDLKEKKFGANTSVDMINMNKAEILIEDEIGDIDVESYNSDSELLKNLEDDTIQAMIIKSVDIEALNDIEEGLDERIRIVDKLSIKIPSVEANSAEVTKEPFNVLVLGTDKRGDISRADALSDVNMIATINPKTKQILITSIPRDYYVDLYNDGQNVGKDKLTHSAKKGTQCTQSTLENLLGIDLNYYAKFNFTSFEGIVDALGGVEVDIPKYRVIGNDDGVFTTKIYKYQMKPGKTVMDGKHALAFVRERKSFLLGDNARNQNQMLVLKAIMKKCTDLSVVTKIDDILGSVSESFTTNMPESDIKSLINMQMDDLSKWDIQSYHLEGDDGKRVFQLATVSEEIIRRANKDGLYVMDPYQETIDQAKEYIRIVMEGKEILKIDKKGNS